MSNVLKYRQLVDSLQRDEWLLLQGIAWIYAGVHEPISPLSSDFTIAYGIKDAIAARKGLIGKHIIDDHYEIIDREFRNHIWKQVFGGVGVPPKPARMYKPCDSLEDDLCEWS